MYSSNIKELISSKALELAIKWDCPVAVKIYPNMDAIEFTLFQSDDCTRIIVTTEVNLHNV